jgi:hypothetical protein
MNIYRANQGVQLELRNGKRVLLGSQRAADLAWAIETRMTGVGISLPVPEQKT